MTFRKGRLRRWEERIFGLEGEVKRKEDEELFLGGRNKRMAAVLHARASERGMFYLLLLVMTSMRTIGCISDRTNL